MKKVSPTQIRTFQKTVWDYYRQHKRPMPWRSRVTPYRVLVSEVMLQQTQVDRVIPKFNAWMKQFPNFKTLATAKTRDVLLAWSGLGYNRRALALQHAAKIIMEQYTGTLPRTIEELDALPGIGAATAASILVYAFNLPYPFIETNVRAAYIHHFFSLPSLTKGGLGRVRRPVGMRASTRVTFAQPTANPLSLPLSEGEERISDTEIFPLVEKTLDTSNPREWYWAIMDYGSYLKKRHRNPSRRSAHYTKQSTFEGSNRQLRGKILKMLLTFSGRGRKFSAPTIGDLAKSLNLTTQKIAPVVAQLIADKFITQSGSTLSIPRN